MRGGRPLFFTGAAANPSGSEMADADVTGLQIGLNGGGEQRLVFGGGQHFLRQRQFFQGVAGGETFPYQRGDPVVTEARIQERGEGRAAFQIAAADGFIRRDSGDAFSGQRARRGREQFRGLQAVGAD